MPTTKKVLRILETKSSPNSSSPCAIKQCFLVSVNITVDLWWKRDRREKGNRIEVESERAERGGRKTEQRAREERGTWAAVLKTLFWILFFSLFLALKLCRVQQTFSSLLIFSEIYISWIILFRISCTLYFHSHSFWILYTFIYISLNGSFHHISPHSFLSLLVFIYSDWFHEDISMQVYHVVWPYSSPCLLFLPHPIHSPRQANDQIGTDNKTHCSELIGKWVATKSLLFNRPPLL